MRHERSFGIQKFFFLRLYLFANNGDNITGGRLGYSECFKWARCLMVDNVDNQRANGSLITLISIVAIVGDGQLVHLVQRLYLD